MGELEKLAGSVVGAAKEAAGVAGRIVQGHATVPMSVMGTGTTCLLNGDDTQRDFALFVIHASPGQGVPTHYHEREDETFHVLEGQMRAELNGASSILGPGDTVHLRRNHPHAWFAHGDQPMKMLMLVHPAGMDHFFPEIAQRADGSDPSIEEVVATSRRYGIIFV